MHLNNEDVLMSDINFTSQPEASSVNNSSRTGSIRNSKMPPVPDFSSFKSAGSNTPFHLRNEDVPMKGKGFSRPSSSRIPLSNITNLNKEGLSL